MVRTHANTNGWDRWRIEHVAIMDKLHMWHPMADMTPCEQFRSYITYFQSFSIYWYKYPILIDYVRSNSIVVFTKAFIKFGETEGMWRVLTLIKWNKKK